VYKDAEEIFSMKTVTALCLFLLFFLAAAEAKADPYTILPNGDTIFNTVVTTQGTFTCSAGVPCTGSGTNSITLGTGANTMTLTFHTTTLATQVGNTGTPVVLAQITRTVTGDGFVFPGFSDVNQNRSIIQLNLTITQTSPTTETRNSGFSFGPGGGTTLHGSPSTETNYFSFSAGPNPSHYSLIVFEYHILPTLLNTNGVTNITADASAIPEPASVLLLSTGLLGAAYARRRRRK
jgi:PEP-CTERM motif